MAIVVIGKKEHLVPEMNFLGLERAWPFVETAMNAPNAVTGVSAGLSIIASGIVESPDFSAPAYGIKPEDINELMGVADQEFEYVLHYLKKNMLANEIAEVRIAVQLILEEAGLVAVEGEPQPLGQGELSLSTGTSTLSSQSSSPLESREVAGTA